MENAKTHYLQPCMIFTSREEVKVTTVLGSCVAVCLVDLRRGAGGINHFMLPLWNGAGLATPKYGNVAIEKLLEAMKKLGCEPASLTAKIFGGAKVLGSTKAQGMNIGERNAELAVDLLNQAGVKLAAQSVGGETGRKIIFNTQTGEVLMKRLRPMNPG